MKILYEENKWVIMDNGEGLMARGATRNRRLRTMDEDSQSRVLTYSSKARAESAFKRSGFYTSPEAKEYIKEEYGVSRLEFMRNREKYLKAVAVKMRLIRER